MARGRRPSFRRTGNKQYGWACQTARENIETNTVDTTVLVAGDADVEVRAVGGTHCNLKRIIGDIVIHPWTVDASVMWTSTYTTAVFELPWIILVIDNDDDPSQYAPDSPTVLSEERVLAHGELVSTIIRADDGPIIIGDNRMHVDVRSNRRIRSDDNIVLNVCARGTYPDPNAQIDQHLIASIWRCLLKFPG